MSKIGIITNDKAQVFQREIIAGVQDVAGDKIEVLVDSIAENPDTRRPISLDIDELDGILVISNILSHDELQSLHQRGKPITLVSHQEEDLPIAAVIQNNTDGILQLVDYVARECGRTQIVFIRGDMNQHDGRQRDNLFQMGLMQHDLTTPDDYNLVGDFNPVTAANSMLEFLETGKPFDAVIAADYLMGCAALDVLRHHDIDIPGDVAVVGFGDGAEAEDMGLTVVGVDVVEIGRRAARQLLSQMDGMTMTGVTWLNTELIVRDSS